MGEKRSKKIAPLNRNFLFRRVYKKARSAVGALVVVYALKKPGGELRLGISASRKIGGAVTRNRARRIAKAAAYEALAGIGGYDIVIVCRGACTRAKSTDVLRELGALLKRVGVTQ